MTPQQQELVNLYELRIEQMVPYTQADATARDKAIAAWSKAETAANLQKNVSGPEKATLAQLNKDMKRHRQKFDNAHRHWMEVKAVVDRLAEMGVVKELPKDPTEKFQPPRLQSATAKKIEAARKHMYAGNMVNATNQPPARDPEGMGYAKRQQQVKEDVEKQLRTKTGSGDVALSGGKR